MKSSCVKRRLSQVLPMRLLLLQLYASLRHGINVPLCPECGEENEPNRRIRQMDIPFGALFRSISG